MKKLTPEEFMELVKEMRECQKMYFKTRSSEHLQKSRILEGQVDKQINLHNETQTNLF